MYMDKMKRLIAFYKKQFTFEEMYKKKTLNGIHQSRVCLPSLKKRLRPSVTCRFLEYAGNERNLIGEPFRRLRTKEH